MSVERRCKTNLIRIKSIACAVSLLSLLHSPAQAQFYGNPVVGGSTLDLIKPPKGYKIDFQFPSGFNCKVDAGDVPGLVVFADQGAIDYSDYRHQGVRGGIALILPLYSPKREMCDKAVKTQNMQNALELAEHLVDSGAMTNEEYLDLAKKYKQELLKTAP